MNGLLIDDDAIYSQVLQRALARRQIDVRIASNGEEALRIARESAPQFVLVDLKLRNQSGLSLIAPLRRIDPEMSIAVVTGYASAATMIEAFRRGADNYLEKPLTCETLIGVLRDNVSDIANLPADVPPPSSPLQGQPVAQILRDSNWSVSTAARRLGLERHALRRMLAEREQVTPTFL